MPDPNCVYIEELSTLFRGRAVHNPRRTRLQSGRGLRSPIDVGDVVYDCEGQLTRLFNCLKRPSEQDEDSILPENFEMLSVTQPYLPSRDHREVLTPITINERLIHAGPYFSKGVRRLDAHLGVSVASAAGPSFGFSTLHKQGAILITSGTIRTRVSPNRPAFEQYMVKHFDDWCSLLSSRQLEVQPHNLMFVTAADYTTTWSNLVYTEHQLQGQFSIEVPSVSTIGGQISVGMDVQHKQSETRDWGPNPEDLELERRCAVVNATDVPTSLTDDQVIFVRGLRGKRRRLFKGFQKLVGEGEPGDEYDTHPGGNGGSEITTESLTDSAHMTDFLSPILDLILENTNADLALVHDEDYQPYLQHVQSADDRPCAFTRSDAAMNGIVYATLKHPEGETPSVINPEGETSELTNLNLRERNSQGISTGTASRSLEQHAVSTHVPTIGRIELHDADPAADVFGKQLQSERKESMGGKNIALKILLLGQSESGKSTLLKQLQLAYAPSAFRAERMVWRLVIYLNLVQSVHQILDTIAISPDVDEPGAMPQTGLTDTSLAQPSTGAVLSDEEFAQKGAQYAERLAPLLDLEQRLIAMLAKDDKHDVTPLGDRSSPSQSHGPYDGRPSLSASVSVETRSPAVQGARAPSSSGSHQSHGKLAAARPKSDWKSVLSRSLNTVRSAVLNHPRSDVVKGSPLLHPSHGEVAVRTTSNWKKSLSLSRAVSRPAAPDQPGGGVVGWWETPSDPVHVLGQCARDMSALWADPWVRTRLAARRIRLEESSGFFLDEIDRITAKKYIPTDDDALKARLKTTGVVEHAIMATTGQRNKSIEWKIFDVGGERSQRQAWAPYFMGVNAIIFLAPISAFDQALAEDTRVNRLEDSLLLWRSVVSNKLLRDAKLVIFLNKCDLLKAKLESGVRLNQYLAVYGDRPNDYDAVSRYLRNKFGLLHQQYTPNPSRELFIHLTTVTDTRQTSVIIAKVRDIIVQNNLKDSRMLV